MKLREKLFVVIGILFLIVAICLYVIPKFFISRDTSELQAAFTEDINKQRLDDFGVRKKIYLDQVNDFLKNINITLSSFYEDGSLNDKINPKTPQESYLLWKYIAEIMRRDTDIDFMEISKNQESVATITIDSTVYYSVSARLLTDNISLILIQKDWANKVEPVNFKPLIGIKFPIDEQEKEQKPVLHKPFSYFPQTNKPSIYHLYPIEDILALQENNLDEQLLVEIILKTTGESLQAQNLYQTLHKAAMEQEAYFFNNDIKTPLDIARWLKSKNVVHSSLIDSNIDTPRLPSGNIIFEKIKDPDALSTLSRIFLYHFLSQINMPPFEKGAPLGAVTFFEALNDNGFYMGGGFLAHEVLRKRSLFDAKSYYNNHKKFPDIPIVDSVADIKVDELKMNYLGNTLSLNGYDETSNFLTMGKSFLSVNIGSFSTQNEWIVIIDDKGQIVYGYDGNGGYLDNSIIKFIPVSQLTSSDYGYFKINNDNYYFYLLNDLKYIKGRVIILVPEKQQPIYQFYENIHEKIDSTYTKFGVHALEVVLVVFGFALIALAIIANRITKPISQLSKAATKVTSGKYSDIILPDTGSSKDEVSVLTQSFKNMIKGLQDKEQIRGLLDKVVSKEVADAILKGQVPTNGQIMCATVLFADIRGFTKMTEHANPQFLLKFLNVYMDSMSKIIDSFGGIIDKYVGDEIMALFGAPLKDKDPSKRAILSALKMIEKLKDLNKEFQVQGFPEIKIGIGIHTGDVVAGNLGAEDRLNYTVLGANVNLASRLCQKAEPMQIRVTQAVLESSGIQDLIDVEELEPAEYKGFSELIKSYSILGLKKEV